MDPTRYSHIENQLLSENYVSANNYVSNQLNHSKNAINRPNFFQIKSEGVEPDAQSRNEVSTVMRQTTNI